MDEQDKLAAYAKRLRESPHNLMSPSALAELETRHFQECSELAQRLPRSASYRRLIDIGAGGGLPGLVIAICRSDLKVELVEARAKKAQFLRDTVADLDLDVAVHQYRAEALLDAGWDGGFDLVTARAVAPLERLLPWTLPFLRTGGLLYAVKGQRWQEELAAAQSVLKRLRGRVVSAPPEMSDGTGVRILVIERQSPSRDATVSGHKRT